MIWFSGEPALDQQRRTEREGEEPTVSEMPDVALHVVGPRSVAELSYVRADSVDSVSVVQRGWQGRTHG